MKFRGKAAVWIALAALFALSLSFRAVSPRALAQTGQPPQEGASPSPTPPRPATPEGKSVEDDEVLSVETSLVNVLFNAVDRERRFVTTLVKDDVRVYENDQAQEVAVFQRETELPLSLAILVDVSASQDVTLPVEQAAANIFIDSILRPADRAAVISFTGTSTIEQDLTSNKVALRRAIESLEVVQPPDRAEEFEYVLGERGEVAPPRNDEYGLPGSTALWDAVWATATELMSQTPKQTRRAIILLSDGDDSGRPYSRVERDDAIAAALKAETVIYSIGVEPDCPGHQSDCKLDKKALRRVSEGTGGRAFFPEDETQLRAAFHQIQQELRTQYLLAYSPTNKARDNSWRRIRIEIVNPKLRDDKIKLSYREGYFAAPPQPARPPRERAPQERLKRPPRRPRKK